MSFDNVIDYLRAITFFWAATEAFFLAFLYFDGYLKIRRTPVIEALQKLFFFIGFYYTISVFTSFLDSVNKPLHEIFVNMLIIFLVPVAYSLNRFRYWSMNNPQEVEKHISPPKIEEKK